MICKTLFNKNNNNNNPKNNCTNYVFVDADLLCVTSGDRGGDDARGAGSRSSRSGGPFLLLAAGVLEQRGAALHGGQTAGQPTGVTGQGQVKQGHTPSPQTSRKHTNQYTCPVHSYIMMIMMLMMMMMMIIMVMMMMMINDDDNDNNGDVDDDDQ